MPLAGDAAIAYVSKGQGADAVTVLSLPANTRRVVTESSIASQMRPAVNPDGRTLVVGLPNTDAWDLWLFDVNGGPPIRVAHGDGLPIMPTWSADGATIFFVEADRDRQFRLRRVDRDGGDLAEVPVLAWNWGEPTARVQIKTRCTGQDVTAAIPTARRRRRWPSRCAGVGPGLVRWSERPRLLLLARYRRGRNACGRRARAGGGGIWAPAVAARGSAASGQTSSLDLQFTPIWDAQADGWYSGEHHFHLNYGGPYTLRPDHLVLMMQGEDLDVGTPLMANLHTRVNDLQLVRLETPLVGRTADRVRTGGTATFSRPYGFDWHLVAVLAVVLGSRLPGVRPRRSPECRRARACTATGRCKRLRAPRHVVVCRFPAATSPTGLPLGLVPDAVLGDLDTLEIACLWSDELGTTEAWYRLLNIGAAIAPSAGTDVMANLYRTMAVGTTRVYVKPEGRLTLSSLFGCAAQWPQFRDDRAASAVCGARHWARWDHPGQSGRLR